MEPLESRVNSLPLKRNDAALQRAKVIEADAAALQEFLDLMRTRSVEPEYCFTMKSEWGDSLFGGRRRVTNILVAVKSGFVIHSEWVDGRQDPVAVMVDESGNLFGVDATRTPRSETWRSREGTTGYLVEVTATVHADVDLQSIYYSTQDRIPILHERYAPELPSLSRGAADAYTEAASIYLGLNA